MANSFDTDIRIQAAEQGYALDKLSKDPSHLVRIECIRQGYEPSAFIFDREPLGSNRTC